MFKFFLEAIRQHFDIFPGREARVSAVTNSEIGVYCIPFLSVLRKLVMKISLLLLPVFLNCLFLLLLGMTAKYR